MVTVKFLISLGILLELLSLTQYSMTLYFLIRSTELNGIQKQLIAIFSNLTAFRIFNIVALTTLFRNIEVITSCQVPQLGTIFLFMLTIIILDVNRAYHNTLLFIKLREEARKLNANSK